MIPSIRTNLAMFLSPKVVASSVDIDIIDIDDAISDPDRPGTGETHRVTGPDESNRVARSASCG